MLLLLMLCGYNCSGVGLVGLAVTMNISMAWDVSGFEARSIFDRIEATATQLNAEAPSGLRGFQVNWQGEEYGSKWMQMRTDEVMRSSAFVGTVISLIVALAVLVVATANIILALLAVGCIACIVVCCIGFLVLCGWSFGFIEAVCITICVGFSIDFVAHIAVAYNESAPELPRYERTRRALEDLGISVTAATVTTSGAALFRRAPAARNQGIFNLEAGVTHFYRHFLRISRKRL